MLTASILLLSSPNKGWILKTVKYLCWNCFLRHGPARAFPDVDSCVLKASRLHTNAISGLVFQIPEEPSCPLVGYPTKAWAGSPTWNADGACASKISWVTPGCRISVSAKRSSGPSDFTWKFGVDIAFKTACLADINF